MILDFGDTEYRIQQWTVSTSDLHSPEKSTWELLSIIKCEEVCYSAIKNYYTIHVQRGAVIEGKGEEEKEKEREKEGKGERERFN